MFSRKKDKSPLLSVQDNPPRSNKKMVLGATALITLSAAAAIAYYGQHSKVTEQTDTVGVTFLQSQPAQSNVPSRLYKKEKYRDGVAGLLQNYAHGEWKFACDAGGDFNDVAKVACREMGLKHALARGEGGHHGPDDFQLYYYMLQCDPSWDMNLETCMHRNDVDGAFANICQTRN
jgi:hypothetical protein